MPSAISDCSCACVAVAMKAATTIAVARIAIRILGMGAVYTSQSQIFSKSKMERHTALHSEIRELAIVRVRRDNEPQKQPSEDSCDSCVLASDHCTSAGA